MAGGPPARVPRASRADCNRDEPALARRSIKTSNDLSVIQTVSYDPNIYLSISSNKKQMRFYYLSMKWARTLFLSGKIQFLASKFV